MYDKIWLAGLGAYSRYEKLGKDSKKVFDNLVTDGKVVRSRANHKIHEIRDKAKFKFNGTMTKIKEMTSFRNQDDKSSQLAERVEELTKVVKILTNDTQNANRVFNKISLETGTVTKSPSESSTKNRAKKSKAIS